MFFFKGNTCSNNSRKDDHRPGIVYISAHEILHIIFYVQFVKVLFFNKTLPLTSRINNSCLLSQY